MPNISTEILLAFVIIVSSISGCMDTSSSSQGSTSDLVISAKDPCTSSSEAILQEEVRIIVDGEERIFRLSAPSSEAGTKLALIIAFHGGTDSEEDFAQQAQFDQLGEQQKFIMAYAIAKQDRTEAEGEWFLNCLLYTSPSPRD